MIRGILPLLCFRLLLAEELSVRTVDTDDQPLPGVRLDLECGGKPSGFLVSGPDGWARATRDSSPCTFMTVFVTRSGYRGYYSELRDHYVLAPIRQPQISISEAERILQLDGTELRDGLKRLFRAYVPDLHELIFREEARLRPVLREIAKDPELRLQAGAALIQIGEPEDLRFLMPLMPAAPKWRTWIANMLLRNDSEEDWDYLRRCLYNDFENNTTISSCRPTRTLRLKANPRARAMLAPAGTSADVTVALADMDAGLEPLEGTDLSELAERAGKAALGSYWASSGPPVFNKAGNKAIMETRVHGDVSGTATFHLLNGKWVYRGGFL